VGGGIEPSHLIVYGLVILAHFERNLFFAIEAAVVL
jgi:hypothetical protein